ncbi:uncharacterized protein LOC134816404 [Bolinopsis microptera]|uniref:uncharacterized protein LOC134816404 n=1 Tax=Bolinopsis microptera TaxID=2820187 RepID=UPI00307961DD
MTVALLLSTLLVFSAICTDDDWKAGAVIDHVDGDVVVCYLSKIISQKNIQNLLSFQAVVTNQTYWPKDFTVGYVVVKWFNIPDESHVNRLLKVLNEYPKIIAFVGFVGNFIDVIQSASFVSSIRIPTFTCSISIKIDQLLEVDNQEFMTRITASRTQQISGTIPSILDGLGTNIVSVFYTQDKSLEFSKLTQQLDLRKDHVDMEYHQQLTGDGAADGKAVVNHLSGDSDEDHSHVEEQRTHTVILLLASKDLAKLIIYLASQKGLSDVVFITDSGGCLSSPEFQTAMENLTTKKVYFFRLCQTAVYKAPELINYIDRYNLYTRTNGELKPASKVIDNWYKNDRKLTPCVVREDKNCISVGQVCTENTNLSRYNHRIYYTTRKLLKSLEKITKVQVEDISKRTFQDLLINTSSVGDIIYEGFHENNVDLPENTTFLRYSNGSMVDDYEVLFDANGHYGKKSAIWTSGEDNPTFKEFMSETKSDIISATPDTYFECSRDCFKGSKRVPASNFLNCWTCVPCIGNTYTENGSWPSCKKCESKTKFLWVNEEKTACDQKAGSVNFNTTSGIIIWIIASLNIAVLIFTIVIYIKYWTSRVIVSSGKGAVLRYV